VIVTSSRSSGGHAVLVSPPVSAVPGDRRCLEFWWSSSPQSVLSVRVLRHDGVLVNVAWNHSYTVTQSLSTWTHASVSLLTEGPFQVGVAHLVCML